MILWKRPLHKMLPNDIHAQLKVAVEAEFEEPFIVQYEEGRMRKQVCLHRSQLEVSKVSRWILKWLRANWTVWPGEDPYAESRRRGVFPLRSFATDPDS